MKSHLPVLLVLCSAFALPVNASGILVFDAKSAMDNASQWKKEADQWMQTAQHYKDQMQAYKDQLATATGVRDVASFVDQAKSLTADLDRLRRPGQTLNDLIRSGGSSGDLDAVYEKYKVMWSNDQDTKLTSITEVFSE